jgi:hypothetical protein
MAEHVTQEVNGAALPGGAENLADRGLQASVGVRDDELDAGQAARGERPQKLSPPRFGLALADV